MNSYNFTGNLGKDCRRSATQSGTAVCGFTVAVKSGYGDKAQTLWIDCSLWGKKAEGGLPDYLLKGQQVAVSGELGTREHEGKTYLTCRVDNVDLIGKPSESRPPENPRQSEPAPIMDSFDDDIPF
jgi:single-strand DNA-binding protein